MPVVEFSIDFDQLIAIQRLDALVVKFRTRCTRQRRDRSSAAVLI